MTLSETKDKTDSTTIATEASAASVGKLGPPTVGWDPCRQNGRVSYSMHGEHIRSDSSFATVVGNTCVFQGKWSFEVYLRSPGVVQIGWCSHNSDFSGEGNGVGDTANSFAYDGSRQLKWNVQQAAFGQKWMMNDVITCCLDCDASTISYFRNGLPLGTAFRPIPSVAYFPAISLSFGEALLVNFGATPLRFPVAGFRPLQAPPSDVELLRGSFIMHSWFHVVERIHLSRSLAANVSGEAAGSFQMRSLEESDALRVAASVCSMWCEHVASNRYISSHCSLSLWIAKCGGEAPNAISLIAVGLELLEVVCDQPSFHHCIFHHLWSVGRVADYTHPHDYPRHLPFGAHADAAMSGQIRQGIDSQLWAL